MRSAAVALISVVAALLAPCEACGADSTATDRISASASGSTLTGTNGGAGESVGWLHNFDPDSLIAVGAEHQAISVAHWSFGSVAGAVTRGGADGRYTFAADVHEGGGDNGSRHFHYSNFGAGITGTYFQRLSIQVEDRRIDVDTTHGNLPKVGVSYLWNPHWQTAVSYANSVSGSLGTRLTSARVDKYGTAVNIFGGGSYGKASPDILNILGQLIAPGHTLREGYMGVSHSFAHSRHDVTLIADYLDLSGSKKATLTLNYVFHVQAVKGAQ
jgi:hypothetical protein